MAKNEGPKTTKLVWTSGAGDEVVVAVEDDKVDTRLASGLYKRQASRRSSSSD